MPSFDEVKLTTTLRGTLATYNPSTGANKNADSLPTGLVYKISDGTTLAATVTVANITTGVYRFSVDVTTGNGFAAGEYYELWVTAVVSGDTTVTQSAPITAFKATTNTVDSLATQASVDDLPTNAELATALGTADDAVLAAIATVQSDTNDIQTRLPAALESGRIAAALDSAARLAIWNTLTTEAFTADSFGDLLLISDGTNGREVKVTGANHIAADVHDVQPDGLSGSTEITNIENASGYLLAIQAGACADPQTASETYAITIFGSTFTVDMAGQTSTGTRTAPTLTKS